MALISREICIKTKEGHDELIVPYGTGTVSASAISEGSVVVMDARTQEGHY
jgi:hypothetical protein